MKKCLIAFLFTSLLYANSDEELRNNPHIHRFSYSSYLLGPFFPQIPHISSYYPWGHHRFRIDDAQYFSDIAKQNPNGLLTLWFGNTPVIYVTNNETRISLVQESKIGVVNEAARSDLIDMFGHNNIMGTFLAFQPIDSEIHKQQRLFLLRRFSLNATELLPMVQESVNTFLQTHSQQTLPLRNFVTALVLHVSGQLLGIGEWDLAEKYLSDPDLRKTFESLARYGISQDANPELEYRLYQVFADTFQSNFDYIHKQTSSNSLLHIIFESRMIPFPESYSDFVNLDADLRHLIAMNFISIGLGGMVHSTANSIDWALATLLKHPEKLSEFQNLLRETDVDFTDGTVFEKSGPLFPIGQWVLYNVFLHPPFSHQFFFSQELYQAELPDGSILEIPPKTLIIVNYRECNLTNSLAPSLEEFREQLSETDTTWKFMRSPKMTASFGGSAKGKTRVCPAAKVSLYEQMIVIATLLKSFSIRQESLSLEVNPEPFPIWSRRNEGTITIHHRGRSLREGN